MEMSTPNLTKLKQFVYESAISGYASGNEKSVINEPDGSHTIMYSRDNWKSHDNYFGGEPYGGRTIIFFKDKPVWMMVYYGAITGTENPKEVYSVLRKALSEAPKEHPYRGPEKLNLGDYSYLNQWQGSIESFIGKEIITHNQKEIYFAHYSGGLIDQH